MERSIALYFSIGAVLNFSLFCMFNFVQPYNLRFFNKADLILKMLSVILSELLGGAYGKEGSASCYADYT